MVEGAMNEITVRSNDLEVTIRFGEFRSLNGAQNGAQNGTKKEQRISASPYKEEKSCFSHGSKAERVREIARGILSDGEPHRRKEIVQAVRAAGLDPQSLTVQLNGHFERVEKGGEAFYEGPRPEGDELAEDCEIRRIEEALSPNGGAR
jgi:hypothetical protein